MDVSVGKSIITYGAKKIIAEKLKQPLSAIKMFRNGTELKNIEQFFSDSQQTGDEFAVEIVNSDQNKQKFAISFLPEDFDQKVEYLTNMGYTDSDVKLALIQEDLDTEKAIIKLKNSNPKAKVQKTKQTQENNIDPDNFIKQSSPKKDKSIENQSKTKENNKDNNDSSAKNDKVNDTNKLEKENSSNQKSTEEIENKASETKGNNSSDDNTADLEPKLLSISQDENNENSEPKTRRKSSKSTQNKTKSKKTQKEKESNSESKSDSEKEEKSDKTDDEDPVLLETIEEKLKKKSVKKPKKKLPKDDDEFNPDQTVAPGERVGRLPENLEIKKAKEEKALNERIQKYNERLEKHQKLLEQKDFESKHKIRTWLKQSLQFRDQRADSSKWKVSVISDSSDSDESKESEVEKSDSDYSSSSSSDSDDLVVETNEDASTPKPTTKMLNLITEYNSFINNETFLNAESLIKSFIYRHHNWEKILIDMQPFKLGYLQYVIYWILKEIVLGDDVFSAIENRIIIEQSALGNSAEEISNILYLRTSEIVKTQMENIERAFRINDPILIQLMPYLNTSHLYKPGFNSKGIPYYLVFLIAKFNRLDSEFVLISGDLPSDKESSRLGSKEWTRSDDIKLLTLYDKLYKEKNVWEQLMNYFPNRTLTSMRTHFYYLSKSIARGKVPFGYDPGDGVMEIVKLELKGDPDVYNKWNSSTGVRRYFNPQEDQQILDFWQKNHLKYNFYDLYFEKFSSTKPKDLLDRLHILYRQFNTGIRKRNELKLPPDFVQLIDQEYSRYGIFEFQPPPNMVDVSILVKDFNENGSDFEVLHKMHKDIHEAYMVYLFYYMMNKVDPHSMNLINWENTDIWYMLEMKLLGVPTEAIEESIGRTGKVINSKHLKSVSSLKTNFVIKEFQKLYPSCNTEGATYNEEGIPSYLNDMLTQMFNTLKADKKLKTHLRDPTRDPEEIKQMEKWTPEEDQKLLDALSKYKDSKLKAGLMAKEFPNRTKFTLQTRPNKLLFQIANGERPDLVCPENLKPMMDQLSHKNDEVEIFNNLKPVPYCINVYELMDDYYNKFKDFYKMQEEKYPKFSIGYLIYILSLVTRGIDLRTTSSCTEEWSENQYRLFLEKKYDGVSGNIIAKLLNIYSRKLGQKQQLVLRKIEKCYCLNEFMKFIKDLPIPEDKKKLNEIGVPIYIKEFIDKFNASGNNKPRKRSRAKSQTIESDESN